MRPLMVIVVWIVLIGGLGAYMHTRDAAEPTQEFQLREASGRFSLDITTTFAVEPDPFAVDLGDENEAAALLVKLNGETVLKRTERVPAGSPIRVADVGIIEGSNEFYIEASPPVEKAGNAHAARIRVMRDDSTVVEHTEWSAPGSKIAATVALDVPHTDVAVGDSNAPEQR